MQIFFIWLPSGYNIDFYLHSSWKPFLTTLYFCFLLVSYCLNLGYLTVYGALRTPRFKFGLVIYLLKFMWIPVLAVLLKGECLSCIVRDWDYFGLHFDLQNLNRMTVCCILSNLWQYSSGKCRQSLAATWKIRKVMQYLSLNIIWILIMPLN